MENKLENRKVVRLPDKCIYSEDGRYFITICTHNKVCLFGNIKEGAMHKTKSGEMLEKKLLLVNSKFENIKVGEYVIMPNHLHVILEINCADRCDSNGEDIIKAIQWYKTVTTNDYIKNVKENGWKGFEKTLWQRSYYEHVIRSEKQYLEIANYIQNNPLSWKLDKLNYMDNYK